MAGGSHKLTDTKIKSIRKPGRYSDGRGVYFRLRDNGTRSFAYIWSKAGKQIVLSLGVYPDVSLAQARERAAECRSIIAAGGDPRDVKEDAEAKTFETCAAEYIMINESQWSNAKHRQQWRNTLRQYAQPINKMPVSDIDIHDVLRCLTPIWVEKPETASRVRMRIDKVLAYAITKGYRTDRFNPATLKGNLENVLPKREKLQRGHHAAMDYKTLPDFMAELATRPALSARMLELTILSGCRTGEVLGARWAEIDLEAAVWTIPAERMKARREHVVPLTGAMLGILEGLRPFAKGDLVFTGKDPKKPLSNMSMDMLLRRMKRPDITVHGFRSTFRDWAGDCTSAPREVAEAALAHVVGNRTEQAYRRSTALDKRRQLMEQWCRYCYGHTSTKVVPISA